MSETSEDTVFDVAYWREVEGTAETQTPWSDPEPECDLCEDAPQGCEICDPEHYEFHWMKGVLPEQDAPLAQVAAAAQAFATHLQQRASAGWVVSHHDNGHLLLWLPSDRRMR